MSALSFNLGGRSTDLFPGSVDAEFICSICQDVLVEPRDTPCRHTFCKDCIIDYVRRWGFHSIISDILVHLHYHYRSPFRSRDFYLFNCLFGLFLYLFVEYRSKLCPLDREPLKETQLKETSVSFKNILAKLIACCDHSTLGCIWKGEWGLLADHIAKDCQYVEVTYSFSLLLSIHNYYFSSYSFNSDVLLLLLIIPFLFHPFIHKDTLRFQGMLHPSYQEGSPATSSGVPPSFHNLQPLQRNDGSDHLYRRSSSALSPISRPMPWMQCPGCSPRDGSPQGEL